MEESGGVPGVLIEACGPAQRAEQAELYAACSREPLRPQGLAWRYDELPHGPAVSFVARLSSGCAISSYACLPRLAVVGGDESTAGVVGEVGDVMTHPDWEDRGSFSDLDRAAMDEARRRGWALAFGLRDSRSALQFLDSGWEVIGTLRRWTHLLSSGAAARSERAREGWLRGALAPLDARRCASRRQRQERRRGSGVGDPSLGVAYYDRFPVQVASIARSVERRFGFMIRRDPEYLRWRFLDEPSRQHAAILVHEGDLEGEPDKDDAHLVGYAVLQSRAGAEKCRLVDVLGRDDNAVDAAIALALDEAECQGHAIVQASAVDGSWWSERLQRWGFLPPRTGSALSVMLRPLQPAHPLATAARDVSRWYFTDADRADEAVG